MQPLPQGHPDRHCLALCRLNQALPSSKGEEEPALEIADRAAEADTLYTPGALCQDQMRLSKCEQAWSSVLAPGVRDSAVGDSIASSSLPPVPTLVLCLL